MRAMLILSIVLFTCSVAYGIDHLEVAWDASTSPDIAGYKLYWGIASGGYNWTLDVGNVTSHVFDMSSWAHTKVYMVATAYDTMGNESEFSNEITIDLEPPAPPQRLRCRDLDAPRGSPEPDAWGNINYNPCGDSLKFVLHGYGLVPHTVYVVKSRGADLGMGTSDASGCLLIEGSYGSLAEIAQEGNKGKFNLRYEDGTSVLKSEAHRIGEECN